MVGLRPTAPRSGAVRAAADLPVGAALLGVRLFEALAVDALLLGISVLDVAEFDALAFEAVRLGVLDALAFEAVRLGVLVLDALALRAVTERSAGVRADVPADRVEV